MPSQNPLVRDRDVEFLLYEVHDALRLCVLPQYADHDRETFDLFLGSAARLAREQLFPRFREMDEQGSVLVDGRVQVPRAMEPLWRQLCELGLISASRPFEVEGGQLPSTISTMAYLYLMAGNAAAVGFALLTSGAAHLIETFGDDALREA
ncbi:MAG TPA: acyl-CoA dehydrogenase, partial [Nannocystis exedens]|nr:acyl-CoA dehydrogenase [Nannocystis exedens]